MRRHRAAQKDRATVKPRNIPADPSAQVKILSDWAEKSLVVPPGHPLAGKPMALPKFFTDFLRDALSHRWSLLSCARKNIKSSGCAVLALAFLVGPLRSLGWRGCVASLSKEKANELRKHIEAIAVASKLQGLTFKRSPQPGYVESETGVFDVLSADKNAGAAAGYDLVLLDELGLFPERARDLVSGLRSSISARNGRVIALSVKGFSPLLQEMIDAKGKTNTAVHLYEGPEDCDIDDRTAWHAANPGLAAGLKSIGYMEDEVERVSATPSDEPDFRAFELNQGLDPSSEMILVPSDLKGCIVSAAELPERRGPCVVGLDIGESRSGTAACIIWPDSGRAEFRFAFGEIPKLKERQRRDSAPYVEMARRGELKLYPGRIVPVGPFLDDLIVDLKGQRVAMLAGDYYKQAEAEDVLDKAGVTWPREFRRAGRGPQGGRDVRGLQRLVIAGRLKFTESLALASAIRGSKIHRDGNANPALDKSGSRDRIDVLSAAVIAGGLAESMFDRPRRRGPRFFVA